MRELFTVLAAEQRLAAQDARAGLGLSALPACRHVHIVRMVGQFARRCENCGAIVGEVELLAAHMRRAALRTRATRRRSEAGNRRPAGA